jgi:hypothetical protein
VFYTILNAPERKLCRNPGLFSCLKTLLIPHLFLLPPQPLINLIFIKPPGAQIKTPSIATGGYFNHYKTYAFIPSYLFPFYSIWLLFINWNQNLTLSGYNNRFFRVIGIQHLYLQIEYL